MTNNQDFRLDETLFQSMIGKAFHKYKCDQFTYANTVTGVVGIYIDDKVYKLRNEQESINYFDTIDDIALWNIKEVSDNDIKSFLINNIQIETPVNEIIKSITLINETQNAVIENTNYELQITRAIIFHLTNKDIYFEKDNVSYSEEIEIKRGCDLINDFPKRNEYFFEQWNDGIKASIEYNFVTIK